MTAVQIPDHLQCPQGLKPGTVFDRYPDNVRTFFNCVRTWSVQAGILDAQSLDHHDKKSFAKNVSNIPSFMNKLLGLNLNQQEIVFTCAVPCSALHALVPHEPPNAMYTFALACCWHLHTRCLCQNRKCLFADRLHKW
jgi:hypothetical protein